MSVQSMPAPDGRTAIEATIKSILRDVLGIAEDRVAAFSPGTLLFGALPEIDSMAVATLLTEIEDRFSIIIDDDDVDGETFESLATLTHFVASKIARS